MPFDGNGTYTPPTPEYPAVAGAVIYAASWNTVVEDIADALSGCITRDGQSPAQANIPMGGFRITGLAAGASNTDALAYGQVLNSALSLLSNFATAGAFGIGNSPSGTA